MVFVIDANTRQPVCNKLVQIIRCNKQSTLRRTFVKIKRAFFYHDFISRVITFWHFRGLYAYAVRVIFNKNYLTNFNNVL